MKKPVNNVDDVTNSIFTRLGGERKIPHDWWGMPEFVQPKLKPYASIDVYFESEDDVTEFAKLIDQEFINEKTKHTWFPKSERKRRITRWVLED
jgi:hypothetical protein